MEIILSSKSEELFRINRPRRLVKSRMTSPLSPIERERNSPAEAQYEGLATGKCHARRRAIRSTRPRSESVPAVREGRPPSMTARLESVSGGAGTTLAVRAAPPSSVCLTSCWPSPAPEPPGRAGAFEQQQFGFTAPSSRQPLAAAAFDFECPCETCNSRNISWLPARPSNLRSIGSGVDDKHHRRQARSADGAESIHGSWRYEP